jgi:hypothetical protein
MQRSLLSSLPFPSSPPPSEPVNKTTLAYSYVGIERVIPLRMVAMSNQTPPTYPVSRVEIEASIDRANRAFRPAGVQFFLRSYETKYMPSFQDVCFAPESPHSWNYIPPGQTTSLGQNLVNVFPFLTNPNASMQRCYWLRYAAIMQAKDDEIFVWVSGISPGARPNGEPPYRGRSIFMNASYLKQSCPVAPCQSAPWSLAHELGHFFGLPHIWDIYDLPWKNPETLNPISHIDFWDLAYGTGGGCAGEGGTGGCGPFNFFESKPQAQSWSGALHPISRCEEGTCDGGTCCPSLLLDLFNNDNTLNAIIHPTNDIPNGEPEYYVNLHLENKFLNRIAFDSSNASSSGNSGTVYKYGTNVMSYINAGDGAQSISPSQAEMIRQTLRFNMPISDTNFNVSGFSKRHLLGQMQALQPVQQMDFDGDGKREIGIYTPPLVDSPTSKGQFRVLLSTRNYSTAANDSITVDLGQPGDTPLVYDFNGDGRPDVAVFGAPTGMGLSSDTARIQACPTPVIPASGSITSCTVPLTEPSAGQRGDTPIPVTGPNNGSWGRTTVYTPSTCQWRVRRANGSTSTYTHGGTCDTTAVPLAGLYDDDNLTDLAVYFPKTATFRLLRSSTSWISSSEIVRIFPSSFASQSVNNNPASRVSSIPIAGMYRSYQPINPGPFINRLSFTLWNPYTGLWGILWNPLTTTSPDFLCTFGGTSSTPFTGSSFQIPLAGIGTNFSSPASGLFSKPTIVNPRGTTVTSSTEGKVSILTPTSFYATSCSTQSISTINSPPGARSRIGVSSVADMTGDGKAEIFYYSPDTGVIAVLSSETNYASYFVVTLGNARSQVL